MIKQLLNSVMAKYRDLSVSGSQQIIDLLVTDKSRSLAQPRAIIVNCRFVSLLDCISLVSKINYSSRSVFLISLLCLFFVWHYIWSCNTFSKRRTKCQVLSSMRRLLIIKKRENRMHENAFVDQKHCTLNSLFVLSGRTKILEAFRKVALRIIYFSFDLEKTMK